ncbi:MAG: hypothetical protein GF414_07480 [Candidatus Altiarchaeales archaeon]|nr:hypothetical protein [Candidatus Altiarchaeales archaeon]
MKLTVTVRNPEYCENGADYARIEATEELVARAEKLSTIIKENDLSTVTEWDNVEMLCGDWDVEPSDPEHYKEFTHSVECEEMVCTGDCIYWEGFYKHTDQRWETDSLNIEALRELVTIETAPLEELPPLLGTELKSEWAEDLFKKRLGGSKRL